MYLHLCQEECHVEWDRQQRAFSSDIIIAELEGMEHVIFLGVFKNGFQGLGVAGSGFAFHERTLILVAYHEIYFDTVLLVIEIEFTSHLAHEISHQILKDSTFVTEQIATQNIRLRVLIQHADE